MLQTGRARLRCKNPRVSSIRSCETLRRLSSGGSDDRHRSQECRRSKETRGRKVWARLGRVCQRSKSPASNSPHKMSNEHKLGSPNYISLSGELQPVSTEMHVGIQPLDFLDHLFTAQPASARVAIGKYKRDHSAVFLPRFDWKWLIRHSSPHSLPGGPRA